MVKPVLHNEPAITNPLIKQTGQARPVTLFVDAHCFDTEYQGTQTFIREVYKELIQEKGLHIYFGAYHINRLKKIFPQLPDSHFLKYGSTGSLHRLLVDIPGFLRRFRFDFAHFQNIAPARKHGSQTIVTLHDLVFNETLPGYSYWYRLSRNIGFKKSIEAADIRTTVSHYSKAAIARQYNIDLSSLYLISNGGFKNHQVIISKSDAIDYIRSKYKIEKFILNVSRLEPRKNQDLLLELFLELELYKQGFWLVFIGKGSGKSNTFLKRLKAFGENCHVRWLEQVNDYDLGLFYKAACCFVYPSIAEGFGIPPLEAASCLTPVLCSNKTAMCEFDFFHPYRFDPSNRNEFKRQLEDIILHPPAENFLETIKEEIDNRYSWKQSAKQLLHLVKLKAGI